MASVSDTSYWINFFTSGGIPAGDATQYAIIFSDNRITREMLLDLSKEYLTDMGITRLGDVISILKHAKQVYNQEARDKVMKSESLISVSSTQSTPFAATPRRSTAASRMVNHFTSKDPEAAPMSQSPVPKLPPADPPRPKRKVSVFERLGVDDSPNTISLSSSGSTPSPSQSSVFKRLGGKAGVKRAASSTSLDDLDQLVESSSSLPYAGVLKSTPSSPKKANIKVKVAMKRPQIRVKKMIKTIRNEEEKSANIQTPEISTTTEGVLSDFAKKESLTLKDRLGNKSNAEAKPVITRSAKVVQLSSAAPKGKKISSIQKRLGKLRQESQSSPVVSSTQKQPATTTQLKGMASEGGSNLSGGVFSRLGKKSS